MDFEFSAEQRMLRDSIRSAYSRDIMPIQRAYPQDRPLPKAAFLKIQQAVAPLGFYGARVPLELGGSGLDHVSWGMFYEEFPPVLSTGLLACEATTTRLARGSSAVVRERFLPGLLDGRLIGASGTSEPNVGSDPRGVETRAVPAGDGHYAISGRKLWTSNGSICDVLMAVVRLESPGGASSLARVAVERAASPFEAREVAVIGLQQGHLSEVVFDNCVVPAENLLGSGDDAAQVLQATWLAQRPAFGLMGVHLCRAALDASVRYAKERVQFGKTIAHFQLVQGLVAEMYTLTLASRLLAYQALALLDRGIVCHAEASAAKMMGTESAVKVTRLAMQLHGSMGLTVEAGLERLHRDACMLPLPEGTTQIQQLIIGRELLGVRAFR
ncbi:MAG: acyl-CoA/acyl-ACP dehydrogenase [Chloroflexi bacterium]|nr:acyl-CoA/acyl-ACP dehydrogenase [Chloroflexota bacterium]